MSLTSELTNSHNGLYHAQINPAYEEDKVMHDTDWLKAADILEEELNLKGQKRVIVLHEKKGRTHAHVVWERYDHDKGIMKSDSFSRLAQDRARETMELEFNQKRTPIRNVNRLEIKKVLTDIWQKSMTGTEFIKSSFEKGYTIAKGELKRPFMVVDNSGRSFDLIRQLAGVKTEDVRDRLKQEKLSTEKEVISSIRLKKYCDIPIEQKPGHWVEKYEEMQSQTVNNIVEKKRDKAIRELREQLELYKEKNKSKAK